MPLIPQALLVGALTVMLCACGARAPITSKSAASTQPRNTSNPTQAEDTATAAVVSPSRPARPDRPPDGTPSLWANDVRVNTLVSDHGIGTAGEPGIALLPDSSGGAFLAWEDSGIGIIRTQRLDAAGNAQWTSGVVSTSPAYQASPSAVADGRGGWLVAWVDGSNGGCDSTTEMNCALNVQRVDGTGARQWGDSGEPITARASFPAANRFAMISDGAQGAYLAWSSGASYYNCCSFYMQHVGPDGALLWLQSGIRVTELPTVKTGPGITGARLMPDGSGGAILAWWNQQFTDGSTQLLAQRIDPSGNLLWNGDGVQVTFTGAGHPNFDALSDGDGGAIFAIQSSDVAGSSNTHIYLQRVSPDGQVMWGSGGVQVSADIGAQITPSLVMDGEGGAFVTWSLWDRQFIGNNRVAVAHVDAGGKLAWPNETTASATIKGQTNPHILSDGSGGAIVGWEDCRTVTTTDSDCIAAYDLYAQRIDGSGQRVWAAEGFPVSTAKTNQGVDYGSEKRPGFEMVSDGNGGVMFAWPDGRLKLCAVGIAGWCDLYSQHLVP